jgi:hypothetical protein
MRIHRLAVLVVTALLFMGGRAHAQDPKAQAKQHFAAGEARFKAGDYRGAITEFAAADALVPSPILSYNIGLCHERLGEDQLAVQRYRDYLERRPDAANRPAVEARIQAAEQRLAAKKGPPAPAPTPPPVTEGPAAPAPPAPAPAPAAKPPATEGPAAPAPPTEGPAAPPAARGGAAVDEGLAKRLPDRPAPAGEGGAPLAVLREGNPPAHGDAEAAPMAPGEAPGSEKHGGSKAKPIYKEWWFWAVVGVSAIIVIDMASGSDSNSPTPVQNGAVLLRF